MTNHTSMFFSKWIYAVLILSAFVLYGNSIPNDYSLDDELVVTGNKYVQQGIAGIPDIITHHYGENEKMTLDYRPVVLLSFALEYQFFSMSPHISHFINVLLYALCLIVLYNFLITVLNLHKVSAWLPLLITLFYAVHPIHTEVVDSLKNRDELFSFLFGLLFLKYGYLFFSSDQQRSRHALLTLVFFTLSLVSKMVGILYFPILLLILLFHRLLKWNKWNYLLLLACIAIVTELMIFILSGLKRETYQFENSLIGVTDPWIFASTSLKIILYHVKMLIWPSPLRFYYGHNMFPVQSILEPAVLLSFVFHGGLFILGVYKFIKKDVLGLIIFCYFTSLYLYSNFPIPYTGMFSERALFLSSMWFISGCALVACTLIRKSQHKVTGYLFSAIALPAFLFYAFQTIQRNFYWKDSMSLMTHDIPSLENSVAANYIYANLLNKESRNTKDSIYSKRLALRALEHYKQTIKLHPYYPDFYYQSARIYRYQLNDANTAEKLFKNIVLIDTNFTGANFELAKIYFERKDFRSSFPYFKKAYKANPTDSLVLFYYAQNAMAVGDLNLCYTLNKEFVRLYPDIKYPYLNLGVYYSMMAKDDSAVVYFEKGIALGDRNPDLLKNMVIYFDKKQNKAKAKYYLDLLQLL